jgi:hypothetical protein
MGPKNRSLTASTNFLQQLVITEVSQRSCRSQGLLPLRRSRGTLAAGVNDPDYRFVLEETKAGFKQTSRANFSCFVTGDFCSALSANAVGSLHLMDSPSRSPIT